MSLSGWICRLICWLGLVGLLVAGMPATRSAEAATCHATDRPSLGLDPVQFAMSGIDLTLTPTGSHNSPRYRPIPCSEDPAVQASSALALVGCLDGIVLFVLPLEPGTSAPPPTDLVPVAPWPTRLDRPPRRI